MGVYQSPVRNFDWVDSEFNKRDQAIDDLRKRAQKAGQVTEFATGVVTSGAYVTFDGDTSVYLTPLRWLETYTPIAGDRVLIGRVSGQWVIMGKISTSDQQMVEVVLLLL